VHNLAAVLEGAIDPIIDALIADEQSKLLGEK
jgi:protein subunit release factor A